MTALGSVVVVVLVVDDVDVLVVDEASGSTVVVEAGATVVVTMIVVDVVPAETGVTSAGAMMPSTPTARAVPTRRGCIGSTVVTTVPVGWAHGT